MTEKKAPRSKSTTANSSKKKTTTKRKASTAQIRNSKATKAEQTKKKKEAFLKAYEASLGNVTAATKKIGINRWTYYDWSKKDPEFKRACEDIIEMQIDFAESQLLKLIRDGDPGSIKFYLQTKGRSRGYGDKIEVTGAEGKDLIPNICIEVVDPKE